MSTDLAAVYLKAANIIRTNGHYKGAYFESSPASVVGIQPRPTECSVCIAGAVSLAMTGWPVPVGLDWESDSEPLQDAIQRLADITGVEGDPAAEPVGRIAAWNDAPERTQDDVVAALENAAQAVA